MKINFPIAIASLLLSIILWLHVQDEAALKDKKNLTLPLTYVGLNGEYVLKSIPETIQVSSEGSPDAYTQFAQLQKSKNQVYAVVDLKDARPDTPTYRVRIQKNEVFNRLNLTLNEPPDISLSVEELMSKQFKIDPTVSNIPQGFVYSQSTIDPPSVVVKGSAAYIANIDQVRVVIDLDNEQPKSNMIGRVQLLDKSGKPISSNVEIEPASVKVTPVLAYTPPERSLIVSVEIEPGTTPAAGFRLVGYSVNPVTVMAKGDQRILDRVKSISTRPIRLTGLKGKTTKHVNLTIPDGVQVSKTSSVDVTLDIQPIPVVAGPTSTAPTNSTTTPNKPPQQNPTGANSSGTGTQ